MADSFSGIGRQRSSGPATIPGRARTVSQSEVQGHGQAAGGRERAASQAPAERQFVNLDGRRLDMSAPRGTYVNLLV